MGHDHDPQGALPARTERRISPRYPAGQLVFDLVVDRPRRPLRRRRRERLPARAVDLSVEGALVLAPHRDHLAVGHHVVLETGGRAVGEIRHVRAADTAGWSFYGVRFVSMDERFEQRLFRYVGQGRQWLRQAWIASR